MISVSRQPWVVASALVSGWKMTLAVPATRVTVVRARWWWGAYLLAMTVKAGS